MSDASEIRAAYLASWRAAYGPLISPTSLDIEAGRRAQYDWESEIRRPSAHVAVAVDGKDVVGVVEACDPPGGPRDLPEITMLYIIRAYWGSEAAPALLAEGVRWMVERGGASARLRVVDGQARARRFYQREGWQLDAELPPARNGLFDLVYYRRDLP